MLRRCLLLGLRTLVLLSSGEPVPVDCALDEEQYTSEMEGCFKPSQLLELLLELLTPFPW